MKKRGNLFSKSPIISGILGFLVTLSIGIFISQKEIELDRLQENQFVNQSAELVKDRIEKILYTANSSVNILAYLVKTNDVEQNFSEVGKSIIDNIDIIDQIQFLDSGKIIATHPLKGNEIVIGYDILKNPEIRMEALAAIDKQTLYFAGPLKLLQGGEGIIGRLPLFEENQFKGFVAVIIDWEKFKKEVFIGFDDEKSTLLFDLLKTKPGEASTSSLLQTDFSEADGPVTQIHIPEGNWTVVVQLKASKAIQAHLWVMGLRFLLAGLLGYLIYRFANLPLVLSKKIEETTKDLQLSNQRFTLATQATSEIIWDWDLQTNQTFRSENFEKLLKYKAEDNYHNDAFWRSIIHPDDLEKVTADLNEAIASDSKIWSKEFRVKNAFGEYLDVIDKGIILRNKQGKAIRIIGSTQNISSRKKAEQKIEEQNKRLSNLIEGTRAGTWEWNVQTGETIFNETWAKMIGYTLEELEPISIQTWINHSHPEDLAISNRILEECFTKKDGIYEAEVRMRHKNGHWIWVMDRGKVFSWTQEGKPLMMFGTHMDITEKKKNEQELISINDRLQSANHELKQFASVASHDMKEPLRMISSFLQLLEKKFSHQLDEKAQQYIHFAVDGSKRLSTLIEDMIAYAAIGFDSERLVALDLNELVQEVLDLKREVIREKKAIVDVQPLPKVWGIPSPIKTVLINLISNSLKYHPKDLSPHLSIYAHINKEDCQITVEDRGIGIEKEFFQKIFNILERLHTKEEYSGTGIGLAVCKKIIEQHGGKIWVDSIPGKGSKFHFTLKVYDESAN
ncbi:PAS domain-containing protein [Algoriphagus confluentis]|uniref:histidine kinase n=1 Tax=Algoriphagus confluentis TaxID=1697556 RepID=A0ABQ6PPH4_9BACT|nr:hypothetical protein Aconfl_23010 [Algoriphagus confluentis]